MNRLSLLCLAFAACATNTDVESELTISQGLYGQLTTRCTEENCVGAPNSGVPIAWFDRDPYGTNDAGERPEPVMRASSASSGFWQFPLDAGARGYLAIGEEKLSAGTVWFSSRAATVPAGLGRVDWHVGPENEGTWTQIR